MDSQTRSREVLEDHIALAVLADDGCPLHGDAESSRLTAARQATAGLDTSPHGTVSLALPKPVYDAMVEHQLTGTNGWALKDVMAKLHEWAEVSRLWFKLEVPSMPLRIARLRWNCLGHFNPAFNDFGLQNEIAIDITSMLIRIIRGEWWKVLGTLTHEQLHFWQQLHGKPGSNNYHNKQYRDRALRCGLIVSSRGVTEGYVPDGPFLRLLAEHNVEVPELPQREVRVAAHGESKLKKWSCSGCARPQNVWSGAANLEVECARCNRRLVRSTAEKS